MIKTQVYLPEAELNSLQRIAKQAKRSVADLIRDAIRKAWFQETPAGPVGLWKGSAQRTSVDHDSIYDEK